MKNIYGHVVCKIERTILWYKDWFIVYYCFNGLKAYIFVWLNCVENKRKCLYYVGIR